MHKSYIKNSLILNMIHDYDSTKRTNIFRDPLPNFHKSCFQGSSCLIKGGWDPPGSPVIRTLDGAPAVSVLDLLRCAVMTMIFLISWITTVSFTSRPWRGRSWTFLKFWLWWSNWSTLLEQKRFSTAYSSAIGWARCRVRRPTPPPWCPVVESRQSAAAIC